MKVLHSLKPALAGLMCLGLVVPQAVSAGLLPTPRTARAKSAAPKIPDIALTKDGMLHGVIVNRQAGPVAGERVVIRQGRRVVAQTTTDRLGEFRVPKFRGGTYQLQAGKVTRQIRVWAPGTAPKSARKMALLVNGGTVTRGQSALPLGITPATLVSFAAAGTGLGISIANASDVDDLEKQVDRITATTNTP